MKKRTALWSKVSDKKPGKDGAFVEASPNPVEAETTNGKTTATWSTGDGSNGVIDVVVKNLQMHHPVDGAEAIEQFETLRAKGGEFLLAPRNSFAFFEGYPELKQCLDRRYRLVEDDEICQIYDLCEAS